MKGWKKRRIVALVTALALVVQSLLGTMPGLGTEQVQAAEAGTVVKGAINLEEADTILYSSEADGGWANNSIDLAEDGTVATLTTSDRAGGFGSVFDGAMWGIQYSVNNLPVIKNTAYTLEFDIVCDIDKKVTIQLLPLAEELSLKAGELYHFSGATDPMSGNTATILFALGGHAGEAADRQGEIVISNVKLSKVVAPINLEEADSLLYSSEADGSWANNSIDLVEDGTAATLTTSNRGGGFGSVFDGAMWGIQYSVNNLPVIKNAAYTLEFDIVCDIDKKVTMQLLPLQEELSLKAGELYHFSGETDPMSGDTATILFALGGHVGEAADRQGEIVISNVKLYTDVTENRKAVPVSVNRAGTSITFQKDVSDADLSVMAYYDIFDSEEDADAVVNYEELTQTAIMSKMYNDTIWQAIEGQEEPLENGQACRVAFVTETEDGAIVSDLYTYIVDRFVPADYDVDTLDRDGMKLVWQDEFDGDSLDLSKWSFQIGTKAPDGPDNWGNDEAQYYTDRNHEVKDGKLIINAKKESVSGKEYTSTRIRTVTDDGEDLFTTKYGRVEARMKLPTEEGTWPAFWMLPEDGSIYEGWAASGEIDIMEARGRVPGEIGGTIHYGSQWPNNVYKGKAYFFDEEVTDISGYHLYSVEWEPGKITWYVDDVEYYSTSNWYSKTTGDPENFTYGAPFDVPYYIILNLAVGGTFDSEANLDAATFPASMEVDYVRVYQKEGGYDETNLVKPDANKDVDAFESEPYQPLGEAGDYIGDTAFDTFRTVSDVNPNSTDWQFFVGDFGGTGTCAIEDIEGTKYAKVDITQGGSQLYALQLIKHMPLAEGYTYQVSFDAKADAERTIQVKPSGDADNGWAPYATYAAELTSEMKNYTFDFTMNNDSDPTARLEFNLGQNTSNVYIGNVLVKQIEVEKEDNTDMAKTPLAHRGGEQIYNGTFDQGDARLAFWHMNNVDASVPSVIGEKDYSRRAILQATGDNPSISQRGIELLQSDQYTVSFDLSAESATSVSLSFKNSDGTRTYLTKNFNCDSKDEMKRYTATFAMPKDVTDREAVFELSLANGSTVTVDNISLKRQTQNNTSVDYTGVDMTPIPINSQAWRGHSQSNESLPSIWAVPDCITIEGVNASINYERMLLHEINIKSGVKYKLSFQYKAEHDNTFALSVQEDNSWITTYEDINLKATTDWQNYEVEFVSSLTSGSNPINLKFLLSGPNVTPGKFYVKDISMVVVEEKSAEDAPADTITARAETPKGLPFVMQVKEGDWRNDFMSAAALGKAVIMIDDMPLTDFIDISTMINSSKGTITIPASYLPDVGKDYNILLALNGFKTVEVATTVVAAVPVTSFTLNKNTLSMKPGDKEELTATAAPEGADYSSVEWETTNKSVATVVDGTVTAVGIGTATITATIMTSTGPMTASCAVTVKTDTAAKPSITKQPASANYNYGDKASALSVTAKVTDGGKLSYQWYQNSANSTSGASPISGATASTYTPAVSAVGTTYYYCVVTNTNNQALTTKQSVNTSIAKVVVNQAANKITVKTSQTKTYGDKAFSLSATAKGTLAYKSGDTKVVSVDKNGKVSIKGCGKTKITITAGNKNYKTVTATVTVTVKPKKETVSSLKSSKSKTAVVKWNKDKKATGYEIQYSTNRNFKNAKKVTVKKSGTTSQTISKLTGGKKYYVRVRAYKTTGKTKIYGAWSAAKNVTVTN